MLLEFLIYLFPLLALVVFVLPKKLIGLYVFVLNLVFSFSVVIPAIVSTFLFSSGFVVDFRPISALFAIPTVIVSLSSSCYSVGYMKEYMPLKSRMEFAVHYLSLFLLYYSMIFLLSSENRNEFLFFWEIMSLTSFVLLLWNTKNIRKNIHAAVGYLVFMHVGFFFLLFAFALLPDKSLSHGLLGYGSLSFGLTLLFFIGFGIKAGLFPIHGWLPVAHPIAPSHISAMMSASMLNMGIYGLCRVTLVASDMLTVGWVLFAVGLVTALIGVFRCACEVNLKRLLAYSSMDNMGVAVLGIGIGSIGKATGSDVLAFCGYAGTLVHIMSHSCFKSVLFLGAGAIQKYSGTLNLDCLGGLLKKMPLVGVVFLIAVCSAIGIPPLTGFAGEFTMFAGSFISITLRDNILPSLLGIISLSLVASLTVVSMVKLFAMSMLSSRRETPKTSDEKLPDWWMISAMLLSSVFVVLGAVLFSGLVFVNSESLFRIPFQYDSVLTSIFTITIIGTGIIILSFLLYLLKNRIFGGSEKFIEQPTWSCASNSISSKSQYSASLFSAELNRETTTTEVNISHRKSEGLFDTLSFSPVRHKDHVAAIINLGFIKALHKSTKKLAHIQTGKVNHYVFYAFLFILAVSLFTILNIW